MGAGLAILYTTPTGSSSEVQQLQSQLTQALSNITQLQSQVSTLQNSSSALSNSSVVASAIRTLSPQYPNLISALGPTTVNLQAAPHYALTLNVTVASRLLLTYTVSRFTAYNLTYPNGTSVQLGFSPPTAFTSINSIDMILQPGSTTIASLYPANSAANSLTYSYVILR
jgi:hypothetical protein